MARILLIDIETAPNVAYVWRFFKENIGPKQVLNNGYLISYAAKWLDEPHIFYSDLEHSSEKDILEEISMLLDDADIVVAHYGEGFDFPYIQGRMVVHGIKPPSPYKTIDTKKIASKEFHFPSNSLEYLAQALDLKNKKDGHKKFPGFQLWLEVLRNNPEAYEELKFYNVQDVLVLEELYLRFRPFHRVHPNVAVFDDVNNVHCPKCNSTNIHYRGYAHTSVGRYHRFQCNDCGGWGRDRKNLLPRNNVLKVNVVN